MKFFSKGASLFFLFLTIFSSSLFCNNADNSAEEISENFELSKKEKKSKSKKSKEKLEIKNEEESSPPEENPELALFAIVKEHSEREEVLHWKEEFLKEHRFKFMKASVEKYPEYRIFVRKTVREQGLPAELEYLPVIESGYNTKAVSRSGAKGMWQFMSNSVYPYLKLDEYMDERLDPWKSTIAGLSKLKDNYKIYGDWLLAIAAYNCGNGKMRAAIKKADGETDFWKLAADGYIPKQTADYIPELLAVAEICIDPQKFDVEILDFKEEFFAAQNEDDVYDFVTVKKPYMLSSIASEIQIEENILKTLNPSFTKGFTPPATESTLRLPKGMSENFEVALKNVKELEFPFKYKVVKGDSLWAISRRYGVTVKLLCDTNGIKENALLKINQILYIPSVKSL
ncbi:MAG: transglycosylase SLT domain-containing protein [Treponemataceae bacterium]|nr:transglycosylase SLT domain-containing protein [Treponemataceae bacterium]